MVLTIINMKQHSPDSKTASFADIALPVNSGSAFGRLLFLDDRSS